MSTPALPDAEAQCAELAELIRPQLQPNTMLVGIHSGGAWVARRLGERLNLTSPIGLLDISFYRDDFGKRGLHPQVKPTSLPFDVEGRPLILIDDVLFTGRTTRAAINELFEGLAADGTMKTEQLDIQDGNWSSDKGKDVMDAWNVKFGDEIEAVLHIRNDE